MNEYDKKEKAKVTQKKYEKSEKGIVTRKKAKKKISTIRKR